jgi:hypothetical protein
VHANFARHSPEDSGAWSILNGHTFSVSEAKQLEMQGAHSSTRTPIPLPPRGLVCRKQKRRKKVKGKQTQPS